MPRREPRHLREDDAGRRIEFVLNEAAQDRPIRDQSVTFALRALSNFYTVGRDCQSAWLSLHSPFRSAAAHARYKALVQKNGKDQGELAWRAEVTNEHQDPLADVWRWMRE